MSVSTQMRILMVLLLVAICGCTSPIKRNATPIRKYSSLYKKYEIQQYDACLAEAEKLLAQRLVSTNWTEVMFTKALCLEEMGRSQEADEVYRQIKEKNEDPKSTSKARLRLFRIDIDQQEHFDFDFGDEAWQRERNESSEHAFIRQFNPPKGNKERSQVVLFLATFDRPPQIHTQEDFLRVVQNSASASPGKLELVSIERSQNEGIWFGKEVGKRGRIKSSALIRIILNPKRMHAIVYAQKDKELSPEDQAIWISRLRATKLVASSIPGFR